MRDEERSDKDSMDGSEASSGRGRGSCYDPGNGLCLYARKRILALDKFKVSRRP